MMGETSAPSTVEDSRDRGRWPYVTDPLYVLPETMPGNRPWPKISIVTPTFNQGRYIEETILSVANQNYPNLEHIIMDGGSTDETASILEKYRPFLAHAVSEKDRGQSHAINKGMALTTGDIMTWLNSDDMLAPGALAAVAMAFESSKADMIAGICELYRDGNLVGRHLTSCAEGLLPIEDILDLDCGWNAGQFFYQPEVMFTRDIWTRSGGLVKEDLFYSMDYDLWVRFAEQNAKIHVIGRPIAMFRLHDEQKTHVAARFRAELLGYGQDYAARTGYVPGRTRPLPNHGRSLRIAFLNDHGWKWGAGIAHERLAQACAMAGHTVLAVGLAEPADGHFLLDQIMEEIIAVAPDIVLVGNVHGAGLTPMAFGSIAGRWPTFIFMHDLWWLTGRCAYTGPCTKLNTGCDETCPTPEEYPQLAPALIHDAWADKRMVLSQTAGPILLAMSTWTQQVAVEALASTGGAPVDRMSLGLPTDVFRPADKRAGRERLKLPVDKFLVLCTATNLRDVRKGTDHVLAVIEAIDERDIVFVTVGHGTIEGLDTPKNVISIPYLKKPADVAMLYGAVDVILAPSREETLGQIYLEGAACGTPSLAFANSGVRDAVVEGVTGHLVKDETPAALMDALMTMFRNRSHMRDIGRWSRLHAENEWSLEASYRSLFQVFRRHGLVDRFELAHQMGLRLTQSTQPVKTKIGKNSWAPGPGVGSEEGPYPKLGINDRFRWLLSPSAQFDVQAASSGPYMLAFRVQNRLFAEQDMVISCDGQHLAEHRLVHKMGEDFDIIRLDCELDQGTHQISFAFSRAYDEGSGGRTLALRFDSLAIYSMTAEDDANGDLDVALFGEGE